MTTPTPDLSPGLPPGLDAHFDHVAVAGPSIDALLPLYVDVLGGTAGAGWTNVALGFRTVNVWFPDDRHVELLEPAPGSAFLESFLARTGGLGGLHHVTFTVASIRETVAALHTAGYETFGERLDDPVWAEAFVHPRRAGGVLLQVAQKGVDPGSVPDGNRPWVQDVLREEKLRD